MEKETKEKRMFSRGFEADPKSTNGPRITIKLPLHISSATNVPIAFGNVKRGEERKKSNFY